MRALVAAAALLALLASAPPARGSTPPDFRRTQIFVQPNVQTRHFLGPLADQSSWGIGMGLTQGAQFGRFALSITLDTDYFLTSQPAPPENSGLQIYGVHLAGRYIVPFGDFRPFVEVGYRHIGIISNALVEETGPDVGFNAITGGIGFRYAQPSPFYVEAKSTWDWIADMDESSLIGVTVAFGIRTIL